MSRAVVRLVAVSIVMLVVASPATGWATEAEPESSTDHRRPVERDRARRGGPPRRGGGRGHPLDHAFLAPATLALGVLGVIGAAIFYGMRIAGRYRVGG